MRALLALLVAVGGLVMAVDAGVREGHRACLAGRYGIGAASVSRVGGKVETVLPIQVIRCP